MIKSILNLNEKIRFLSYFIRKHNNPAGATLFLTRECNYSCSYCNVGNFGFKDISKDHWFKIIDKLADLDTIVINIVGGEPTLRPDLCEIIDYAYQKKIFSVVHSNFGMVTNKLIEKLSKSNLFAITASLDSLNGFGKSNYHTIFRKLKFAKTKGIIPIVSAVATSRNIEELPRIAEFANSEGILFNFGLYQNIGGVFSPEDTTLVPSQENLFMVFSELRNLKKRINGIRTTNNFLKEKNLFNYYKKWKCNPKENNWIIINNDGFLMCCEEYPSNIDILKIESLNEQNWIEYRIKTVNSCPGCYHHCYFDAETLKGKRIIKEILGIIKNINFLRIRGADEI